MRSKSGIVVRSLLIVVAAFWTGESVAQKKYDPGASDTEIKIGNIMPYSGPVSSYSVIGKTEAAYFNKINAEGGINGRQIKFISYDDSYSPPKAIEQARKLVESDEVLLIFQPVGTQSNSAIQKYMNAKKVPQLFVGSGATKFGDPKRFPWTMGWMPNYQSEGRIYAKYILDHFPDAKIAVFWQNDDAGKDQFKGLRDGLGNKASMIVADKSYEVTDPSIEFSDRDAARFRSRYLLLVGGTKRICAGHQESRRDRLEAEVLPGECLDVGGERVEARRLAECERHHIDGLPEGPYVIPPGRTIRACMRGGPSWTNTTRRVTSRTGIPSMATQRRRPWSRCSSRVAMTSRVKTS